MTYLPPSGPIPAPDGVAGMTITIGTPLLVAIAIALVVCLAAVAVVIIAGRQSTRRGVTRRPVVATSSEQGMPLAVRRAAGGV